MSTKKQRAEAEADAREAELKAQAIRAPEDVEDALADLQEMQMARRPDPAKTAEYEALRDKMVAYLRLHGPRYYLDKDGFKHYAFATIPEQTVIKVGVLQDAVDRGELPASVLAEVAPRKGDLEAFRRAVRAGRIPEDLFVEATELVEKTGHVNYSDPELG